MRRAVILGWAKAPRIGRRMACRALFTALAAVALPLPRPIARAESERP